MKSYNQFTIRFAGLILKVREIRGKILDEVIFTESILDLIILKYFCESSYKIGLFQATLLNQEYISLDSKIKTFKNLNFGEKFKPIIKELSSELNKAREVRNNLAHRMIDNSNEAVSNGELRLTYYEKGRRKYQPIKEKYLEDTLRDLENLKAKLLVVLMNADFKRSSEIDILVDPTSIENN